MCIVLICGNDNGGCSQLCTNSSGILICSCQDGFLLHSDGSTCQGDDNFGNLQIQALFLNIKLFFLNIKLFFYVFSIIGNSPCLVQHNNFVLSDINECSNTNGGCSDICTNMIGSFSCSCHKGYALDNDGFTCQGIVINYC